MMNLRLEHPNPQWERKNWVSLNGKWAFDFDFGLSAIERKAWEEPLNKTITVPFCPESRLSGIGYTDFIPAVCYKRSFEIAESDLAGRVFLHFGAVDYKAYVYVNGILAGTHEGGYVSFSFDITPYLHDGTNELFVYAHDDTRSGKQPTGKQSTRYESWGCYYTRTTGIWQSVWLEKTPKNYIKSAKFYPDAAGVLTVLGEACGDGEVLLEAAFEGKTVGKAAAKVSGGFFAASMKLDEVHLWDIGQGNLYDLTLSFGEDAVKSYFGLRTIALEDGKFVLNGRTVFLRTVLDQGFYPDGVYTAPSDAALKNDILLSMNAGFNGARLHEKVFEARFLYHADKLGYLVFGEYPNWGLDHHDPQSSEIVLNEWAQAVARDFNHPAIIGWCPFNETWGYAQNLSENRLLSTIWQYTKAIDPTRPCIDTSGNYHEITDLYDVHDYEQDPQVFKAHYDMLFETGELYDQVNLRSDKEKQTYTGGCVFMSEYGGIRWDHAGNGGWGYGQAPKTQEEFLERYEKLTRALLENPKIMGLCYTQLYDVEQEVNGLYTYDRRPKFDMEFFKRVNTTKAAIE